MIHRVILLIAGTAVDGLVVFALWAFVRRSKWPDFGSWCDAEGMPIFVILWFLVGISMLALGWF